VDSQGKTLVIEQTLGRLQALMILERFDLFLRENEQARDATFEVRKAQASSEEFFNSITKHAVTLAEISEDTRFALEFRNEKANIASVMMYGTAQNALDDVKYRFSELTRVVNKRATPRGPDSPELRELEQLRASQNVDLYLGTGLEGVEWHTRARAVFNEALARGDLALCRQLVNEPYMVAWLGSRGASAVVSVYRQHLLPKFISALLPESARPYFTAQQKLPSLVTPVILLLEQALRLYCESLPTDAQMAIKQVSSSVVVTNG
jgi:hypothetical protein